jgi:hypothetical protein
MVDDGFVVFANNVDTEFLPNAVRGNSSAYSQISTYHNVVAFEFVRIRLYSFRAESFAVNKSAI